MLALIAPAWEKPTETPREFVPISKLTLGEVITALIDAKVKANRRPVYVRTLRYFLKYFARGRETQPIASFGRREIEDWFSRKRIAPSSRRTQIQMLSVLFGYAVKIGCMEKNPCTQLDTVYVDRKPPLILSPRQVRKMLNFARTRMHWRLPQLVLGVYAGIRPTEMTRIFRKDIDLERGHVRVDAAASKIRRRRIVPLDPKAVAWLKRCRFREHKPIGSNSETWKRILKNECGIDWRVDLLRHTAASYLLAKHDDPGKVARWLGNSPNILLQVYTELVDPADCRRFWKCPKIELKAR